MRELVTDLISALRFRVNLERIIGIKRPIPLYVFVVIILVIATCKVSENVLLGDNWSTLDHDKYGFSLDYPTLWEVQKYSDHGSRSSIYMRARLAGDGVIYIYQQTRDEPETSDAVNWGTEVFEPQNVYALTPLVDTRIGAENYPAMTQSFKTGWRSGSVYFLVHNNNLFMIKWVGSDEDAQVFTQILASLRLD